MAESKQRLPAFVGPSYTSRASRFDIQRCVNMFIELNDLGAGKGQEPAVLIGTPGLKFLQTIGAGPIRATYTASNTAVTYVVSGNEVYALSGAMAVPIQLSGNLSTSSGPISIRDNGSFIILVDGTNGYNIEIGVSAITTIVDANFYDGASVVTYQDGIFVFNYPGTSDFFISDTTSSDFPDVTFPANNIGSKSGNSDVLVSVHSNNRQLYLTGAADQEIWYNAGSGLISFARQDGRFSQIGCVAAHSVVTLGESFFWLGSNAQGGGIVYMLENALPTIVSTNAVSYAIQNYGNLAGATAWAYQQEGHLFYCLNIPGADTTWCYDMSSKQWHERQSTVNGITGRHLAQTHCVLNDIHIVGDYRNGNIYELDLDTYTDNNDMILRIRQSPHVSESLYTLFYMLFEVDFQFGVGLVNDQTNPANAVDPQAVLEISRDGGQTWGIPMLASIGKIGRWLTRARWQRLGRGRDIVFRVTVSDPVKVQMLSAMIDVEQGLA